METTAHRPSRESRAFDSDQSASHPPTVSYIRARAKRADLPPDDPIPLFLSDPLGAPNPREYAPRELRSRIRIAPRLLAAVLATSAAIILAVLFQSDLRNFVTASAGAATGAAPEPVIAATNTMLASADTQDLPAPPVPSREAIATAYQIALQAQTPVQAPDQAAVQGPAQAPAPVAAQPAPPEPVRTLDADTLAALMTRAKRLIGVGDIAAARLLLERAANAKDATAALLLAQTYDPAVLGTSDARSVIADVTAARDWYQRAADLGSADARQRLTRLSN